MNIDSFIGIITAIVLGGPLVLTFIYLLFHKDEDEQYNAATLMMLKMRI
jgi:hypothetical protein